MFWLNIFLCGLAGCVPAIVLRFFVLRKPVSRLHAVLLSFLMLVIFFCAILIIQPYRIHGYLILLVGSYFIFRFHKRTHVYSVTAPQQAQEGDRKL